MKSSAISWTWFHKLGSPKWFYAISGRMLPWLAVAAILLIGTGVVSASVRDGERLLEAGRMGPGEVLGLEGLLDSEASIAEFRSLTSCLLYRIDKAEVRSCLEQRDEVKTALSKLQRFRQDNSQSLLLQRPAEVKKGGFLHWLQRKA